VLLLDAQPCAEALIRWRWRSSSRCSVWAWPTAAPSTRWTTRGEEPSRQSTRLDLCRAAEISSERIDVIIGGAIGDHWLAVECSNDAGRTLSSGVLSRDTRLCDAS
jgi:hypothetical protein